MYVGVSDEFLSVISIRGDCETMLTRYVVVATRRRHASSLRPPLALAFSSVKDTERNTVEVVHTKPHTSYVQVEQDIAALQREIRTAYQYVVYPCLAMIVPKKALYNVACTVLVTFSCRRVFF